MKRLSNLLAERGYATRLIAPRIVILAKGFPRLSRCAYYIYKSGDALEYSLNISRFKRLSLYLKTFVCVRAVLLL